MSLIISLVIGGIVGWLASIIMKTNAQMGWIANVLVGVVGSALGYWVAGLLGIAATGGVVRFVIAIAGAVLLIVILRAPGVFKKAWAGTCPKAGPARGARRVSRRRGRSGCAVVAARAELPHRGAPGPSKAEHPSARWRAR